MADEARGKGEAVGRQREFPTELERQAETAPDLRQIRARLAPKARLPPGLFEVLARGVPARGDGRDDEEDNRADERHVVEVLVQPVKLARGSHAR
eukprot:6197805-Pleurochrysis_carterae.AAC.4